LRPGEKGLGGKKESREKGGGYHGHGDGVVGGCEGVLGVEARPDAGDVDEEGHGEERDHGGHQHRPAIVVVGGIIRHAEGSRTAGS